MFRQIAYAKLDLAIHITPKKRDDGYYPVHYIDCQIDLCDRLFFEKQKRVVELICNNPAVPKGEDNFVNKAAFMLKKIVGHKNLGAKITLFKNIPVKAGFGGGSSDGAAAVLGLSRLWRINLNEKQIAKLAHFLGKDFYYSLHGKLSEIVGEGKNYQIRPLETTLPNFWLLVVVPDEEKPSSGWVYRHLRDKNLGRNFDKIVKLKTAIKKRDRVAILKNLTNDFEPDISYYYPVVSQMKQDLVKAGASVSLMAGAGFSVVGFFESKEEAEAGKEKLKGKYRQILVARTIN